MECGICYTDKSLMKTNCGHIFCDSCLKIWREIKNTCPVCRGDITNTFKLKPSTTRTSVEKRVTRSMTKIKREREFYDNFKMLVVEFDENGNSEEKTKSINNIIKLCFNNYKLLVPTIYNLVIQILDEPYYEISNRYIIKKRLIDLKPYINYNSTIEV